MRTSRLDRFEKGMIALQKSQQKTDLLHARNEKLFAQLIAQQAKTEEQFARTDAQLEKNTLLLAETKRIISGIGLNLGDAAEDFFAHSLQEKRALGNIQFDSIAFGLHGHKGKIQDEFDVVMYNGDAVAIVEIKHKVHPADLDNLLHRKLPNFRALYPLYSGMKIFLGIAGMSFPKSVLESAEKAGIAVLRQKGDVLLMSSKLKSY